MSRAFVSPMGDPTFANAAQSIAEALFPSARTQAAARMAGAQYQGQLAQNEQTGLENTALQRSNDAYGSLGDVIADPRMVAVLRAGGGNADQLAGAIGRFQEQGFRQGARDKAVAGNYGGAVAEQFGLASAPVRINDIDSGYQLNPYQQGGAITATGETLADIVLANARAGQADAAAGASRALEARRRDEMANPGRYRSPGAGGGVNEVSPSEAKSLDDLIGNYIPGEIDGADGAELEPQVEPGLRNEALLRASELFQQNRNAQASVAQAVQELFDIQQGRPGSDGWFFDDEGEAPAVRRRAPAPAPAPAAPGAAPVRAVNPQTGEVIELRNGQWVPVQ